LNPQLFKSGKPEGQREERLARLARQMDDGMGLTRDDPGYVTERYAHFADGTHGRMVYTQDTPEPHPGYVGDRWERLLTWDLDEDDEVWPASPVDLAVEHG
jgi:hypothetical protein